MSERQQQLARRNKASPAFTVKSYSRSKQGKKVVFKSGEQITALYGKIKGELHLKNYDFNLSEIMDGQYYITTFKHKDTDPRNIGKVYDGNGKFIAEGVIDKESAFYFSLDEGLALIDEWKNNINSTLDAYLVDVDQVDMEVTSVSETDKKVITKITKKGEKEPIMIVDNKNIIEVKEEVIGDVIRLIKDSNKNTIRNAVTEGGRNDYLWYIFLVTGNEKEVKKYFQISSYKKKWDIYAHVVSMSLYQNIETIIYGASRLYKEFKEDYDNMKKDSELASIMKKETEIYPEFPEKFKKFVNLLYEFCPIERLSRLVEVMKILYQICKIFRDFNVDTKFSSSVSVLDIHKLLSEQNAQFKYVEYNRRYNEKTSSDLYVEAMKAVKKDAGFKKLESKIREALR